MSQFFVKTESSSSGPFTGIELREAALAGILRAESIIGGGPNGPWHRAMDIGLFSEKKMPLPHPSGTKVPVYHVRGLSVSIPGPFKLRELIGFAARGMLHMNATIQSNVSEEWFPVDRIPVLNACLTGDLVLVGADGKVVRRAHAESKEVPPPTSEKSTTARQATRPAQLDVTHAASSVTADAEALVPALVAKSGSKAKQFASSGSFQETPYVEPDENQASRSKHSSVDKAPTDGAEESVRWWKKQLTLGSLNPNLNISRRMLVNSVILFIVVGGIGTAFSQYRKMGMRPERIMGTWVAEDGTFAIAFRQDGSCSAFNTTGKSWSGEYVWTEREEADGGFEQDVSSVVDTVDSGHLPGPVLPNDGFVRLRTSALSPSYLADHAVSDLFLRRDGEALMVGYLSSLNWSAGQKTMEAGWVKMLPQPTIGFDAMSDISSMVPEASSGPANSRHVAEVVQELMMNYERGEAVDGQSAVLCYSKTVDAAFLLKNYGVPDEARPVFPFEQAKFPSGHQYSDSQMVRYGPLQLILAADGTLQCAQVMQ